MRKLIVLAAACTAMVALLGFSATAFADDAPRFPDPDCDAPSGDGPYNNDFILRGLSVQTTDSDVAGEVSGIQGSAVACGPSIGGNVFRHFSYHPPVGMETINNNARIDTAPGVQINPLMATDSSNYGRYAGSTQLVRTSAWNIYGLGVLFPEITNTVMKVDNPSECVRENNAMVGGPVQGTMVTCMRADGSVAGILAGHNWNWTVLKPDGRYTLVVGPFVVDFNPGAAPDVGITALGNFKICGYAGAVNGNQCGDGSDPSRWMQKNGTASAPDCNGGNGPNGLYKAKVYNQGGSVSPEVQYCVRWNAPPSTPDPDCDAPGGDGPYNNTHAVNGFNADTSPRTSGELADLMFKYTVCGTTDTNGSLNDHVDIKQPPNSTIENTFGMQPADLQHEGRYAGSLTGRIAHGPGSNRQYSNTTAKLTVEYADLRFLERERWAQGAGGNWGKTNPIVDNCNRQADPGVSNVQGDNNLLGPDYLAGENIGTFDYQPWVPVDSLGRPTTSLASFIASCFKLTSTSGPFNWYAWAWQTFSVVDGHRHLTVGPIHTDTTPPTPTDDNPTATFNDDPVGFTSTLGGVGFQLKICGNAGAVGGTGCGGPTDPVLHRNGDGQGCYEIVATNKGAAKTTAQSSCVTWAPPGSPRKGCDKHSISKRCLLEGKGIKKLG